MNLYYFLPYQIFKICQIAIVFKIDPNCKRIILIKGKKKREKLQMNIISLIQLPLFPLSWKAIKLYHSPPPTPLLPSQVNPFTPPPSIYQFNPNIPLFPQFYTSNLPILKKIPTNICQLIFQFIPSSTSPSHAYSGGRGAVLLSLVISSVDENGKERMRMDENE